VGSAAYQGAAAGATHSLASLEAPGVGGPVYALRGRVRSQGVEGIAYLEMWSDFGERGRFFSRTQAAAGPMAGLSGDQEWREFLLPFFPEQMKPERLEINVVFPAGGKLWLDSLELVQYQSKDEVSAVLGAAGGGRFGAGPLWLGVGVGIGVSAALITVFLRRRAAQAEMRRIAAFDAGGGIS